MKLGKSAEAVDLYLKTSKFEGACGFSRFEESVNRVDSNRGKRESFHKSKSCFNCGGEYPHQKDRPCQAIGRKCSICQKNNHLESCCRSQRSRQRYENKVQMVNMFGGKHDDNNSDDDICWALKTQSKGLPTIELKMCQDLVKFTVDTASSVNIIDEHTWSQLKLKPNLKKSIVRLYAYGSKDPISILGEFKTRANINGMYHNFVVQVVGGMKGNILGNDTVVKMGIKKFINQLETKDDLVDKLKKQYPSVFSGKIGKLKDRMIKLHINENVKPIRQRNRPVSFHLREGISKTIQLMMDNDIIEKVDGPTPWVSPIVPIVKENGEVRVCTDAKLLNTALEREVHNSPTVDEVAIELNEAKVISKFDLRSGYNQLVLHPDSRDITVFSTHVGLFRYKRLSFGLKSAAEIFQKTIEEVLVGIQNCRNISDDIIVYGRNQEEHDTALHLVLQRMEENGLTVNIGKCEFSKSELEFFGLHFFE